MSGFSDFNKKKVKTNVNKYCAVLIKVKIMWVSFDKKLEKLYKVNPKAYKVDKILL